MDDLTRRRLSRDHETLRSATAPLDINMAMNVETPALDAELARIGIPRLADLAVPSVMLGLPGGMMASRGIGAAMVIELFDIASRVAPSEPYDIDAVDFVPDALDAFTKKIPDHDEDTIRLVTTWARMFRNAYAECVFAIEDASSVDDSLEHILRVARDAGVFMIETFFESMAHSTHH